MTPPEERFLAKIQHTASGCWQWLGSSLPNGYGQFWSGDRKVFAHRFAYERYNGPIAAGMNIDHLCRNRGCVNPAHLEQVTHRENVRRGAKGSLVTVCPHGHAYTPETTMVKPNGTRRCRTCHNERKRAAYYASKVHATT